MTTREAEAAPAEAPVLVDVLTDEELSVVARPGPMPVLPFLSDLHDRDREVARRAAYRSLVARGIVTPPTAEAVVTATDRRDGTVELLVRQDIRSVVALREGAQLVVAIARTTAATQDYWYAHLVDDVVLLEEVSRDGFHRFALAGADRLEQLAVAAAVHPDAGDAAVDPTVDPTADPAADTPDHAVPVTAPEGDPTPPDAVLERLGAAFVRADVVVRRPGDTAPPVFALFTGPGGCWCVAAGTGRPLVAEPLTAAAARARVADAVAAVRAETRLLGG